MFRKISLSVFVLLIILALAWSSSQVQAGPETVIINTRTPNPHGKAQQDGKTHNNTKAPKNAQADQITYSNTYADGHGNRNRLGYTFTNTY